MTDAKNIYYRVTNIVAATVIGATALILSLMQTANSAPSSMKNCDVPNISCAKTVSAAVSQSGRIWLAWTINGHLYVNYTDNKGELFSRPTKVNKQPEDIAANNEKRPKIAIDTTGNIYVSWIKKLPEKWTSNIRFSWSKDGLDFSPPITVNDDTEIAGHSFNEMIVSDIGEVTIVWLDSRHSKAAKKRGEPFVGSSIYWATINPLQPPGKTIARNTKYLDGNCVCCRLALTTTQSTTGKKQPILMWRHIFDDNIRDHALGILGKPLQRVSFEQWKVDGCPHHGPSISNQKKRVHMSWFNDAPSASGLFYAYTDNLGKTVSPAFHFAKRSDSPSHPSLITNANGNVLLAWKTFDGIQSSIKLMTSIRGEQWSKPRIVAQFSGKNDYPFLLPHPNGDLLLWHKPGHALVLSELTYQESQK